MNKTSKHPKDNMFSSASSGIQLTITKHGHPQYGQQVLFISENRQDSAVLVKLSDGFTASLPRSWTDYDIHPDRPKLHSSEVLLDVQGLREVMLLLAEFKPVNPSQHAHKRSKPTNRVK